MRQESRTGLPAGSPAELPMLEGPAIRRVDEACSTKDSANYKQKFGNVPVFIVQDRMYLKRLVASFDLLGSCVISQFRGSR